MVIPIALPFILVLQIVGGGFTHNWFGGRFNRFRQSEDDVPIWTCQSRGYLLGDPWTFLGVNLSLGCMNTTTSTVNLAPHSIPETLETILHRREGPPLMGLLGRVRVDSILHQQRLDPWLLHPMDTHRVYSNFTGKGRRMGTYRAVADIAEAMQEDLADNICVCSEKELESAVRRSGPLEYYVDKGDERNMTHVGLSSRHSERAKLGCDEEYG